MENKEIDKEALKIGQKVSQQRAEIKTLDKVGLQLRIVSQQENLGKAKFAHAISTLDFPLKIKTIRREIARLQTALSVCERIEKETSLLTA